MADNGNPAQDLAKQQRMAARRQAVEEEMQRQAQSQSQSQPMARTGVREGGPVGADPAADLIRSLRRAGMTVSEDGDDITINMPDEQRLGADSIGATRREVEARNAQDLNNTIAPEYLALREKRSTSNVVAKALRDGALAGVSEIYIREQLERIVEQGQGRINFDIAGKILERNVKQLDTKGFGLVTDELSRGLFNSIGQGFFGSAAPDLGGNRRLVEKDVQRDVNEITSGMVDKKVTEIERRNTVNSLTESVTKAFDRAAYELSEITKIARSGDRRAQAMLPNIQRQYDEARQAKMGLRDQIEEDPHNLIQPNLGGAR